MVPIGYKNCTFTKFLATEASQGSLKWGRVGHTTLANVAQNLLGESAQSHVKDILGIVQQESFLRFP